MHTKSEGIVVVGIHTSSYVMRGNRLPAPGEYLIADSYSKSLDGGKASNQALAAAKLGAHAYLVARVGDDEEGKLAIDYLNSYGVDTAFTTISDKYPTGMGTAFMDQNGVPMGMTDLGANLELSKEHIDLAASGFAASEIMLVQLEIPVELALYACDAAKRWGLTVIMNPAPADGLDIAKLNNVDILTPNEPEAKLLAGFSPDAEVDIEHVAKRLFEMSRINHLIITRGKSGSLLVNKEGLTYVYGPDVKAVDTSGAGDCFNAALALALNHGLSIERAVWFATRTASLSVMKLEVWPSYPTLKEVEDFYGELW